MTKLTITLALLLTGCAALQTNGSVDPAKVVGAGLEIAQCVDTALRDRALKLVPEAPPPRPLDPSPYEGTPK